MTPFLITDAVLEECATGFPQICTDFKSVL